MPRFHTSLLLVLLTLLLVACDRSASHPPRPQTVRCAVIGGMVDTQMFYELGKRFQADTGHRIEIVATGPKDNIALALKRHEADFITMHSSDTMVNLVADGYALDPQPWCRNELVIVGPAEDPAGIRGLTDAGAALAKIKAARAPFVVHASLGSQEVLRDLSHNAGVVLEADQLIHCPVQRKHVILRYAEEKHAYTLIGRIPFLDGKMGPTSLALMVQGDPRLRRPYLAAVANPRAIPSARIDAARALAEFLRTPQTQAWLATYGIGRLDQRPLFFPVQSNKP